MSHLTSPVFKAGWGQAVCPAAGDDRCGFTLYGTSPEGSGHSTDLAGRGGGSFGPCKTALVKDFFAALQNPTTVPRRGARMLGAHGVRHTRAHTVKRIHTHVHEARLG